MKYIAFDIGCIECGEESRLIGVYDTREKAQDACNEASVAIHDLAGHSGCVMLAADSQIRVKSSGR